MTRFIPVFPIFLAMACALPGVALRFFHFELPPHYVALITGSAILAASFLLLWACDVAQMDIPQTLALAVIALIAVLPEYAVDMYFTWMAGKHPDLNYSHYAIANMTGANRLLIGVAWAIIAGLFWLKTRASVKLEEERRTEVFFLGLATLYAFVIPMKGSLAWYDGVIFVGLYVWYIRIASSRACGECEFEGPAACIAKLPPLRRRLTVIALLLFAAGVILADAELFSEGLVGTGRVFGVDEFLLVQWLAPIASEAPEFVVAVMFALRGQAGVALGSLLSAKLNQWTLLVGMIPGVYGISAGTFDHPIPMGSYQMHEILLTAAQSLLAVMLLVNLRLGIRGALWLFGLFTAQFALAPLLDYFSSATGYRPTGEEVHVALAFVYVALAIGLFMLQPKPALRLWHGCKTGEAVGPGNDPVR